MIEDLRIDDNFLEVIPCGILMIRDNKIVYSNKNFIDLLGYKKKVLSKMSAYNFIHPEDRKRIRTKIELLLQDKIDQPIDSFEFKAVTANKETLWLKTFNKVISHQGKTTFLANVIDITKTKKEIKKLENWNIFYHKFHNSLNEWIWEIDKNGIFTYSNSAVEHLLGYDIKEVVGSSCIKFCSQDKKSEISYKQLREKLSEGSGWKGKKVYAKSKDGSVRILESSGIPVFDKKNNIKGYRGIDRDISEKQKTYEDLKNYKTLVENSQDIMLILNPDGTRRFVSSSIKDITGYKPDELVGRHFTDIIPQQEVKRLNLKWKEMLHSDETKFKVVHKLKTKSGEIKDLEVTGINYIGDENINALIATVRDVTEAKKTENKLRLSQELFSKAFQNNPLMVGISTIEDGKYIEVNESVTKILGYSRDELIGHSSMELGIMLKQDRDRLSKILKSKGEIRNVEIQLYKKSGDPIDCLAFGSIINIGGKKRILASMQDITEKKKAEKKLLDSRKMMESQYKSIPVPTYTWEKLRDDFVLINYNDAAKILTEGKIANYLGIKASDLFKDRPSIIDELNQCYNEEKTIEREMLYYFKSTNKERQLDIKYAYVPPNFVLVHTEDITERKKAELELVEARNRYQKLFSNSSVGIAVVEPNGKIVEINTALAEIIGEKKSNIEQTNAADWYVNPEDRKKAAKYLEETGKYENFETAFRHKNGQVINVILNSTKITIAGSQYYQTTVHDITDLKKAEKKLKKHQQELQELVEQRTCHLQKEIKERKEIERELNKSLKEKEILIKEINHRVKNNLQILSGIFELQTNRENNKNVLKILLEGKNRIKSMALIYELLQLSDDVNEINLSDYIQQLVKISKGTFEHKTQNIKINTNLEDIILPFSRANPCALAINELLSNALQHAFPPEFEGNKEIFIYSKILDNSKIYIEVKDNGIGLPKNFKLDNANGFGFHLIKIIVEDQLAGKIDITKTDGTTFKIIFPKE